MGPLTIDSIPFQLDEIEDCRIILKAGGKHYSIVPHENLNREDCKIERIALAISLLLTHSVIDTPLEELKQKLIDTSEFII